MSVILIIGLNYDTKVQCPGRGHLVKSDILQLVFRRIYNWYFVVLRVCNVILRNK